MGHNNMKQNFKMTTRCNKYFSPTHRKIMSFYCIKEKFDYTSVGEYSSQTTKDADSGFCSRMEENISTTKKLGEHQICDSIFSNPSESYRCRANNWPKI